jgi:hypothetical protein
MKQGKLKVVPKPSAKPLDVVEDIYAKDRAKALDLDRWASVHTRSDRQPPLDIHIPAHKRHWLS